MTDEPIDPWDGREHDIQGRKYAYQCTACEFKTNDRDKFVSHWEQNHEQTSGSG